jgi:hypothetical protein
VAWHPTQAMGPKPKLIVHVGNAKFHTAKVTLTFIEQTCLKKAPHPTYLLDLAPSDFFLLAISKD